MNKEYIKKKNLVLSDLCGFYMVALKLTLAFCTGKYLHWMLDPHDLLH